MQNDSWQFYYNLLEKYYEEHNNLNISSNYKVKLNDYKKINLRKFIKRQRELYAKQLLDNDKVELLNKIEMIWNLKEYKDSCLSDKWLRKYEFAKIYFENNGNLNIPYNYVVANEQGSIIKLGEWFYKCKLAYDNNPKFKISKKELELLNLLDPNWYMYYDDEILRGYNDDKKSFINERNNSIR